MEIFDDGGMSVQTFECVWAVWCCAGSRLLEVAQFALLPDAEIYVDAVAQDREEFCEVYTILQSCRERLE